MEVFLEKLDTPNINNRVFKTSMAEKCLEGKEVPVYLDTREVESPNTPAALSENKMGKAKIYVRGNCLYAKVTLFANPVSEDNPIHSLMYRYRKNNPHCDLKYCLCGEGTLTPEANYSIVNEDYEVKHLLISHALYNKDTQTVIRFSPRESFV